MNATPNCLTNDERAFYQAAVALARLACDATPTMPIYIERGCNLAQAYLRLSGVGVLSRLEKCESALQKIVNMTDGHPIDADRRDRINQIARGAFE